eukprot:3778531-Pleurochrysis_carterae.AAC.1
MAPSPVRESICFPPMLWSTEKWPYLMAKFWHWTVDLLAKKVVSPISTIFSSAPLCVSARLPAACMRPDERAITKWVF